MKILFSAVLCCFTLFLSAQQDSLSSEINTETGQVKKNGFLSSLVVDESGMPLVVQIDITDHATNQVVQRFQSSRIGYSRISLPSGSYNVIFSRQGYLFHSEDFVILDSAGYDKKLKKIILKKVEVGNNTVLNNISFEEDQSVLRERSFSDLDRVLGLMNEIVTLQIEISGDMDGGPAKDNKELAEQRAKVLIDYLVSKGIDRSRLMYKGPDAEQPIEIVDTAAVDEELAESKMQLKIVNVGAPQKLVQTQGQYYAVPETPTKKGRKNKKGAKKEEVVVVKQEEIPVITERVVDSTTIAKGQENLAGDPGIKTDEVVDGPVKNEEKVTEEAPAKTVDVVTTEPEVNQEEKIAEPETKTEEVVAVPENKENSAEETAAKTADIVATEPETTQEEKVTEPETKTEEVVAVPENKENSAEEAPAKTVDNVTAEPETNQEEKVAEPETKTEEVVAVPEDNGNGAEEAPAKTVDVVTTEPEVNQEERIMEPETKTEEVVAVPEDNGNSAEEAPAKTVDVVTTEPEINQEEKITAPETKTEEVVAVPENKENSVEESPAKTVDVVTTEPETNQEEKVTQSETKTEEIVAVSENKENTAEEITAKTVDVVTTEPETNQEEKITEPETKVNDEVSESAEESSKAVEIVETEPETKPVVNDVVAKADKSAEKNGEKTKAQSAADPENSTIAEVGTNEDSLQKDSLPEKTGIVAAVDTTVYRLDELRVEMANAGSAINTTFPEFAPLINADGTMMIFTSRRPLNKKDIQKGRIGKENVYVTYYDTRNKAWQPVEMLDPAINLPETDNTAVGLSADGQHLLLYRGADDKDTGGDIYESVLRGDQWSEPVRLPAPINANSNETYASLSSDGQTIYFVSDRKGGFGGKDIWSCTKDKFGKWGEAINLGAAVNSSLDEECVFVHANGNTLFFSSKGHESSGGFDIYKSTLNEVSGKWEKVTNMGPNINTAADDMYLVVAANGKYGYYSSFETIGNGSTDIFRLSFADTIGLTNTILLKGSVIDENGRFIKSKITLADQTNDKPLGLYSSNRATGKYIVPLPAGKNYDVKFSAKGYTTFVEPVETKGLSEYGEFSKIILLESRNAYISGRATDENGSPLSVLVEAIDKTNKQWIEKSMNDEDGNWRVAVPTGKSYGIVLSKPGYFFQSYSTIMPNAIGYERNFKTATISKVEQGKKIVLNNVFFEPGKALLKSDVFSDLDLVVKLMIDMPSLQVEVSDNANNLSASKENQQLSKDRAKAVADYLINQGCDSKRIKFASYETKEPLPVSGKKGEQAVSRIELKVLKLDEKAELLAVENHVKEIAEELKRLDEANRFGEEDTLNMGEEEYVEEIIDTTVISEYDESESFDSMEVDTTGEEYAFDSSEPAVSEMDTLQVEIRNMGSLINSPFGDYAPLISADGSKLIFTSRRPWNTAAPAVKGKPKAPQEGRSNIYSAEYDENLDQWQAAVLLKPSVNPKDVNNTAIALSNDSKKLLLYTAPDKATVMGDIYESAAPNGEWTSPVMVLTSINSANNETSASFSPDGRTVYFVSDRQGGAGLQDIWYSTQNEKGVWGEAVNMGEPINTDKDEESVFMHPNGNTLFFSSKGHSSKGGYDIFMSEYNDSSSTWEQPRSLGSTINTSEDDLYFVMAANGKTAFYSAVKPNGFGKEDIYEVLLDNSILKKNTTLLKGKVVDETGQALRARITIKDKTTGTLFGSFTSSATTGKYVISLPEGKNYELKAIVPEHTTYVRSIDLTDKKRYDELTKNIVLETKNAFITSKVYDETGRPIDKVQIEVIDRNAKRLIERTASDSEGYSRIAIPSNKRIDILFKKPGYLFQSVSVSLPKFDPLSEFEKDLKTITLQKMEPGKKTVLSNVSYEFNQTTLTPESFLDLARVIYLLNNMPSLQVEVSDHTDNTATSKEMVKLSKERAKAVADQLITMGADKKRIRYKSYGAMKPVAPNESEQGRAMNQRVELKILKIDSKTELEAEEKRLKEEQAVASETETDDPFSSESLVEKKDSAGGAVEEQVVLSPRNEETAVNNSRDSSIVAAEERVPETEEPVTKKTEITDIADIAEPGKNETEVVATEEEKAETLKEEPVQTSDETVTKETETVNIAEPVKNETEVVATEEEKAETLKEEPVQTSDETVTKETETVNIAEPVKNETEVVDKQNEITEAAKEEPVQTSEELVTKEAESVNIEAPVKNEVVVSEEEKTETITEEPVKTTEEPVTKETETADIAEPDKKGAEIVTMPEETSETVKKSALPERFVKYDKDNDGILTYIEIINVIDEFFNANSTTTQEDINAMIDYFFDN